MTEKLKSSFVNHNITKKKYPNEYIGFFFELEIFKLLCSIEFKLNDRTILRAIKKDKYGFVCDFEFFKWIKDNNITNNKIYTIAAKYCIIDILKWMEENNFSKDETAFAGAALKGRFNILRWMEENNFPKDERTFICAARYGDLEILEWMKNNNFPKNERTFACAAKYCDIEISNIGELSSAVNQVIEKLKEFIY